MTIARRRLHFAAAMVAALIALPLRVDAGVEADSAASTDPASILLMIRMAPPHARPDVDYGDGYAGRSGTQARRRVAEDIARTHGLRLVSQWPMPAIGIECFVLQVPPDRQISAVVESVSRDPRAVWAQPLQIFRGQSYNDPLFDQQPVALAWQLEALHAATTGRDVLIAQIDSGAEVDHPDLVGQIRLTHNTVAQTSYRAEIHGTAVAGILVARPGNGLGMVGVAPGARVMAVRACWERVPGAAVCDSLSLAKALQFAIDRGARVLNLSVAGPPDRLLADLLTAALARGAIVVAAVDTSANDGGFPASLRGVIAVVATDGPTPATATQTPLAAPGRDLPTTLPGARWGLVSGASFAAAEVSGMVALLLELQPQARGDWLDALLRRPDEYRVDASLPAAMPVQACRSVSAAAGRCVCDCAGSSLSSYEHR
jgi:subtilisin family serine protease